MSFRVFSVFRGGNVSEGAGPPSPRLRLGAARLRPYQLPRGQRIPRFFASAFEGRDTTDFTEATDKGGGPYGSRGLVWLVCFVVALPEMQAGNLRYGRNRGGNGLPSRSGFRGFWRLFVARQPVKSRWNQGPDSRRQKLQIPSSKSQGMAEEKPSVKSVASVVPLRVNDQRFDGLMAGSAPILFDRR